LQLEKALGTSDSTSFTFFSLSFGLVVASFVSVLAETEGFILSPPPFLKKFLVWFHVPTRGQQGMGRDLDQVGHSFQRSKDG
jgi:hypothetical protein